jgi:anti-anti-sigma factor
MEEPYVFADSPRKDLAMTEDSSTFPAGVEPADGSLPHKLPAAARLAVAITLGPQRYLARVAGEIDMDVAEHLREVLERALHDGGAGLEIDMSNVTFCDGQGLNVLLRLRLAALADGHPLTIIDPGPTMKRLLALTDTTALFAIPPTQALPQRTAAPTTKQA